MIKGNTRKFLDNIYSELDRYYAAEGEAVDDVAAYLPKWIKARRG